jgi:hypothetical protein
VYTSVLTYNIVWFGVLNVGLVDELQQGIVLDTLWIASA